ncbi:MAG: M1 family aminopeptidase [Bacteroidales bacterium]
MIKLLYTFLICFCFVIHSVFGQRSTINIINITSYDIKANCDFNKRFIDITANLIIEKTVNSNSFKILLCPYASIKSVKTGSTVMEISRISFDDDTLLIIMPELFKKNNILNICFEYTLPIDSFIFKNLIFQRRETRWYPLQYDDIASWKLNVVTPNNYTVFTVGDLIDKKNINNNIEYKFENNNYYSYPLIIAKSDSMSTLTKSIDSININFYFVSTDTAVNNKIIDEVCKSFSFYNKYIGRYKHKQLNLVEIPDNRVQFVQSLSTLIVFGPPFVNYFKLGYSDWPPHEVAHQWWGGGIYINSKTKGRWFLEESINEYFKALYIQNMMGNDSFKKQLKTYLANYNDIDKSKESSIFEIKNVYVQEDGYVIYQKGPLVVNKLKNLMGNESWEKFIKEIYNTYYGEFLTFDEFIKTLSKYDNKGNLVNELNKWLSETGYTN